MTGISLYSLISHSSNECKDRWLERQMDRQMDERERERVRESEHVSTDDVPSVFDKAEVSKS